MPAELTGGAGTAARPALEWTGGEGEGRRRGAAGGARAQAKRRQQRAAAAAHPLVRVVLVLVVARRTRIVRHHHPTRDVRVRLHPAAARHPAARAARPAARARAHRPPAATVELAPPALGELRIDGRLVDLWTGKEVLREEREEREEREGGAGRAGCVRYAGAHLRLAAEDAELLLAEAALHHLELWRETRGEERERRGGRSRVRSRAWRSFSSIFSCEGRASVRGVSGGWREVQGVG